MGIFTINRSSTGPPPTSQSHPPSSEPSSPSSSPMINNDNRKSWFSKFTCQKAKTFPRSSPQSHISPPSPYPSSSREPSPPTSDRYSWFARVNTTTTPLLNESDDASNSSTEENDTPDLTPAEEYAAAPKWRRDAAKKRVRDMRAWLCCEEDAPTPFFLTMGVRRDLGRGGRENEMKVWDVDERKELEVEVDGVEDFGTEEMSDEDDATLCASEEDGIDVSEMAEMNESETSEVKDSGDGANETDESEWDEGNEFGADEANGTNDPEAAKMVEAGADWTDELGADGTNDSAMDGVVDVENHGVRLASEEEDNDDDNSLYSLPVETYLADYCPPREVDMETITGPDGVS